MYRSSTTISIGKIISIRTRRENSPRRIGAPPHRSVTTRTTINGRIQISNKFTGLKVIITIYAFFLYNGHYIILYNINSIIGTMGNNFCFKIKKKKYKLTYFIVTIYTFSNGNPHIFLEYHFYIKYSMEVFFFFLIKLSYSYFKKLTTYYFA